MYAACTCLFVFLYDGGGGAWPYSQLDPYARSSPSSPVGRIGEIPLARVCLPEVVVSPPAPSPLASRLFGGTSSGGSGRGSSPQQQRRQQEQGQPLRQQSPPKEQRHSGRVNPQDSPQSPSRGARQQPFTINELDSFEQQPRRPSVKHSGGSFAAAAVAARAPHVSALSLPVSNDVGTPPQPVAAVQPLRPSREDDASIAAVAAASARDTVLRGARGSGGVPVIVTTPATPPLTMRVVSPTVSAAAVAAAAAPVTSTLAGTQTRHSVGFSPKQKVQLQDEHVDEELASYGARLEYVVLACWQLHARCLVARVADNMCHTGRCFACGTMHTSCGRTQRSVNRPSRKWKGMPLLCTLTPLLWCVCSIESSAYALRWDSLRDQVDRLERELLARETEINVQLSEQDHERALQVRLFCPHWLLTRVG